MIRKLLLAFVSVLVALALAEAFVRAFYLPSTARIEGPRLSGATYHFRDAELQIVPRPHQRAEHAKRGSFTSTFTTNSLGLRDREHTFVPAPGVTRIVVIGDSFAWGFGVDDDAIFPALLEQRMPDTEVVNLGVTGYGLIEEIGYFRRLGVLFRPDVLLVALVQNDIAVGHVIGDVAADTVAVAADTAAASGFVRLKRQLAAHVRLYALISDAVNSNRTVVQLLHRLGIKSELGDVDRLDFNLLPALRVQPAEVQAGWNATFDRLRGLRALTDSLDIRLVVALVPALQAVEPGQLERSLSGSRFGTNDFDMDEPYRTLARFLEAGNVETIDPLAVFRDAFRSGTRLYLRRDMHFNERGHEAFSDAIARHFERTGLGRTPRS